MGRPAVRSAPRSTTRTLPPSPPPPPRAGWPAAARGKGSVTHLQIAPPPRLCRQPEGVDQRIGRPTTRGARRLTIRPLPQLQPPRPHVGFLTAVRKVRPAS